MKRMMLVQMVEHSSNEQVLREVLKEHFRPEELIWLDVRVAAAYIFLEGLPHGFNEKPLVDEIQELPNTTVWIIVENNPGGNEEVIWWHGETPDLLSQAIAKFDKAVTILQQIQAE